MLSQHYCDPGKWLNVYRSDPRECAPHVRADPSCVGGYYNHAAQNDNNCGCLTSDVDCTDEITTSSSPRKEIVIFLMMQACTDDES